MPTMTMTIAFPRGYIAHPYWVEREKVINITKSSGMNRAKSDANKESALRTYLDTIEMSKANFDELSAAIKREKSIKKWRRDWKIRLIEQHNLDWHDLFRTGKSATERSWPAL